MSAAASWQARDDHFSPISASDLLCDVTPNEPCWRRILYEKQPFEDNYVDPDQFMQDMKKNENLITYTYTDIICETFVVIQQVSIIVIFVNMFLSINRNQVALSSVIAVDVITAGLTLVFYNFIAKEEEEPLENVLWSIWRQSSVLTMTLLLLSPIFQTLTVSYTEDTIIALTIISLAVHVLATDYSYLNAYTSQNRQSCLSVNAAIFASVLLASRIPSPAFASALIGFGTICFNLSPKIRHYLKLESPVGHIGITFLLCGLALGCLTDVPILAASFIFGLFIVSGAVPWFFVSFQHKYKCQINGPWDEAKPQNSAAAAEWANAGLLS
eukprot:Tbor_TRINITY_DN3128_c0_g1::TRINITY_DN3128_c0_g1_i1::g.14637::m.14637/K03859/PIGC, GPI2; phosphatidylinositol glycan, class C